VRAARDHVKSQPSSALEVALSALTWLARGAGYELTCADACAARDHAFAAANLGVAGLASDRVAESAAGSRSLARWVRQCLGLEAIT
jgi:hypothetical protein